MTWKRVATAVVLMANVVVAAPEGTVTGEATVTAALLLVTVTD